MLLYATVTILFAVAFSICLWVLLRTKKILKVSFPEPTIVYRTKHDQEKHEGAYFGFRLSADTVNNMKAGTNFGLFILFTVLFSVVATSIANPENYIIVAILGSASLVGCALLPAGSSILPPMVYTKDPTETRFYLSDSSKYSETEYKKLVLHS